MFKKLAAIAAAVTCSLGTLPEAQAQSWDYCTDIAGMHICAIYGQENDVVAISSRHGYVRFGIKCVNYPTEFSWEYEVFEASTGNSYSKPFMAEFSEGYCEGRLGLTSSTQPTYKMA